MPQLLINDILRQLQELQEGSRWFDQSLKDKISGLSDEEAFTRPIPELHSVAEHISHIIAWRKECLLRFNGQRTELMNAPEDWQDNTSLKKTGWPKLKALLYESTDQLIKALQDKDDAYLEIPFQDTDYNNHYLIEGILQHDLYHLGQMGITVKMLKAK
jgi:uncharacterized damage-inducible protein DinB